MQIISLDTAQREQLIDISSQLQSVVSASGMREGLCHLWCLHTTAGLTINENADPNVKRDLLMALEPIVGRDWPYTHAEGNSVAHVKSSLMGCELSIPVSGGELALGTWQGVLFAEFDGPRRGRQVAVTLLPALE
jgi:secondary thiamine-phosphate synthase enzyme